MWQRVFRRKPLEMLLAEMHGDKRLHRVLGPISLTSLGVGVIIGAGIFATTGASPPRMLDRRFFCPSSSRGWPASRQETRVWESDRQFDPSVKIPA